MNYYKRHLGDLAKSCGHLSQGAMGAYDLLLDWHYSNEMPLPLEKADLYRIGRAFTKQERDNVDRVLALFFIRETDGYVQKRAQEEIAKANAQADTNRRIAEAREAKKRATKEARTEHDSCSNRATKGQPSHYSTTPQQEQELESPYGDLSPAAPDDPHRPPCPHERIIALYHEILPELRRVREWNETRRRLLGRRWAESSERQSLGWWREFFGYVRKSDWLMGRRAGHDGRPFDCDLEWLIRPTNFAKVIEGKYEDAAA